MTRVTAVAAGERHTCALTTTGGVKCWGNNHDGELGDGTKKDRITPVDVVGLTSGVTAITTGWRHVCALMTTGGIKCWGNNHDGQLGDGTEDGGLTPVDRLRIDEWSHRDRGSRTVHLCIDQRGWSEVLGEQSRWAAGGWQQD